MAGRVAALDLGTRRIGLAVSDETRLTVRTLPALAAVGAKRDAQALRDALAGLDVVLLVVGLPLLPSGDEGDSAKRARAAGEDLARRLQLPVRFVDESLTTVDALRELGGRKVRPGEVDSRAAALILEAFLAEEEAASRA